MPTNIIQNDETAQVRLLRSMYVRGEYHAAGTVVSLGKRDAREMIYQERAAPFVSEATPPPAVAAAPVEAAPAVAATDSAPAPSLPATGGDTTPTPVAEPAAPVKARRSRKVAAEPAPAAE